MRVYESLKIDEVRAMRQHFPMNLHGKQIGHVLGYIPGSLYGQAVLQGMSRAYQGVLEEANRRIVEFRLRATAPASGPASGVSGFDMGLSPPTPPAFNTPGEAFSLLRMSRSDARRSFWAYACGWSYDWRRCGAQTPPSFPILATRIAAMTPAPMTPDIPQATMTTAPMTPDIPQATMTPAPTTPDIHQATITSAPTTPVSYPF